MKTSKINSVYFSATRTTRSIIRHIAQQLECERVEYDITQNTPEKTIEMGENELLLVGVPVYAGRVPAIALPALQKFKGTKTPAIIVCVYGNRDYDDALLELNDVVEANGFKVISAGAFIAQHSIFPQVGANRPDDKDNKLIADFARKSRETLDAMKDISLLSQITIKGNRPYKVPGKVPLHPKANRNCTECGTCAKLCPTGAIPIESPRKKESKICITCGRCIVVCPANARRFAGVLYKLAGSKFIKANSLRKEPDLFYI